MIAYTKPKKVEWFEYTGDTPEFREWCKSVGITVKQQGEDLNIRPPEPNYPEDHRCSSPITLYKHLGDCVIAIGDNYFSRMSKEHFLKHYDIPLDLDNGLSIS